MKIIEDDAQTVGNIMLMALGVCCKRLSGTQGNN